MAKTGGKPGGNAESHRKAAEVARQLAAARRKANEDAARKAAALRKAEKELEKTIAESMKKKGK